MYCCAGVVLNSGTPWCGTRPGRGTGVQICGTEARCTESGGVVPERSTASNGVLYHSGSRPSTAPCASTTAPSP
eukprot:3469006-Rhodomonas_salina.1